MNAGGRLRNIEPTLVLRAATRNGASGASVYRTTEHRKARVRRQCNSLMTFEELAKSFAGIRSFDLAGDFDLCSWQKRRNGNSIILSGAVVLPWRLQREQYP